MRRDVGKDGGVQMSLALCPICLKSFVVHKVRSSKWIHPLWFNVAEYTVLEYTVFTMKCTVCDIYLLLFVSCIE